MKYALHRGFTIVELIVVVAVIGVLAATVTVAYNGVTSSARDRAVLSDADKVSSEVARYGSKNGGLYGSAVQWYSQGSANTNIRFIPTSGNIIDVVSNADNYCIRVYNPASGKYKTLQTAATIGSSNTACASQQPSTVAQNDSIQFSSITWQQATSAGSRNWVGVTSSDNGQNLAAVAQSSNVYTSNDGGVTWVERTASGSRIWMSIDSSSDGSKIIAANRNYLHYSSDYGATWTQLTSAGTRDWRGVAMSSDGTKIATQVSAGYLYTSSNSGVTWTEHTGPGVRNWDSISSSSNGSVILATNINSGNPYVSQNGGATWTAISGFTNKYNYASAVSADGSTMALTDFYAANGLQISRNGGSTWTAYGSGTTGSRMMDVALSSDGSKVILSKDTIYSSVDSAASFVKNDAIPVNAQNYDIATSSNGAKIIISGWAGYIYIGSYQ